jgi:hypothetical protein
MNNEANKTKGIHFNRSLVWKQENEYQESPWLIESQLAIGFASVSIIRTVPCYNGPRPILVRQKKSF